MTTPCHGQIIDAHNHPDWHGHNLARYLANMDQYGIARTWLFTWESPRDEYDPAYGYICPSDLFNRDIGPIGFDRCLAYVQQEPTRFVLGYAPDPRRPEALDRLRAGVEIYGVKLYGELKLRMMYDNPDALAIYRYCGQQGLPVTVHLDYEYNSDRRYPRPNYWYGGGIEAFERAIAKCPDTVFLGHAPGFWGHISNDNLVYQAGYPRGPIVPGGKLVTMMRQYPNLHCDISAGSGHTALSRDLAFTTDFLLEFQDRVLYARDYFDNRHQELLNSLKLPLPVLEKLYFRNARRLLHEE
jgi:predicted TIM-barrel fold metal-dependent hydrolase